ncbi:transient receptor potential channel [Stylonychia lemnae]|uniref:Transient receptor potential channel n=1 Tax=Stylonychia lemnae TaxID=5949 RepID=A0A078BBH2_STYLE|nr:transient receptor potential channel [Stylonychia lemnae]|eukprot:CDW91749.1 transient receptor potential channel [Stylonychia lemnae]
MELVQNRIYERKKTVESKVNSDEVTLDVVNELIKQGLDRQNTSNDPIGLNIPSSTIQRNQINNSNNNLQQKQLNNNHQDLMNNKAQIDFTKATESIPLMFPDIQDSSNVSIQNKQVNNSFKGGRGSKTPKASTYQDDGMKKSQTKSESLQKFSQEQYSLSKVNSEQVKIKSQPLGKLPTKRDKQLGVIDEVDDSIMGSKNANQKEKAQKIIEEKKNELQKLRMRRQELVKRLNKALDKSRFKVEQILRHQDIPENKKIIEEADSVGIQKKYQSSEKEQRQHGLPLYFYIMRKNFEQSYQEFLLLITHGHLQQAYTLCLSDGFIKAHDYQIKNMLVFEEFYKKNNYEYPKLLMEKKQQSKTLMGKQKSSVSVKYEHGYKFQKGYLFNFVKKMIMPSDEEIEKEKIRQKNKEKNKNQTTPDGNDDKNGEKSDHINEKSISYKKMMTKRIAREENNLTERQLLEKRIEEMIIKDYKAHNNGALQEYNPNTQLLNTKRGSNNVIQPDLQDYAQPQNQQEFQNQDHKNHYLNNRNSKSFYNQSYLKNIVKNKLYETNDQSIILALYLMIKEKKIHNKKLISMIIDQMHDEVLKFFEIQKYIPANREDLKGKGPNDITNQFDEDKLTSRLVNQALKLNEPEIAILAGRQLVKKTQNPINQQEHVFDYFHMRNLLSSILRTNRDKIVMSQINMKGERKNTLLPNIIKLESAQQVDLNIHLNEEQKKSQLLEQNRKSMIEERNLEIKEKLLMREKKNQIKSLIKFICYFIKTKHTINLCLIDEKKEMEKFPIVAYDHLYEKAQDNRIQGKLNFLNVMQIACQRRQSKAQKITKRGHEMDSDFKIVGDGSRKHVSNFEEDYFLTNLLKWEMPKQLKKINPRVTSCNRYVTVSRNDPKEVSSYCFDIIKLCIESNKSYLAEMVLKLRNKDQHEVGFSYGLMADDDKQELLDEGECESLFIMLLSDPNGEKLELLLEIFRLNKTSKQVLKKIYSYIVSNKQSEEQQKNINNNSSLLKKGRYIYYCAELLAQTDVKEVEEHYSKEIALNLGKFCKSNELKYCHSPFLTLVLMAEFLKKLAKADVLHQNILHSTLNTLLDLAQSIQKSIKNEKRFKYIHQQKDIRGREALDIIVQNQFYLLLQYDDIGMIAEDLWRGPPILQLIFTLKSKKLFEIDHWRAIDILMFIMIIIDYFRLHMYFYPPENDDKFDTEEESDLILQSLNAYRRHIMNASITSFIVFLVWFRIISVLITTQKLGHMIQAIYFMIKMTLNFLIIFACWLICCSAIFTAIYYDSDSSDGNYRSFAVTVTTLFSATLAVYDDNFTILEPLGSILMSMFVVISAVMLINLLIALLTEAYQNISRNADSRHRAILINYRHRWSWNDYHSYLIFAPPPLNAFALLILPFGLFLSDKPLKRMNNAFCKIVFILIYVLPMVIVFFAYNEILFILAWLKGFYSVQSLLYKKKPAYNALLWLLFGIFILQWVIIKDMYYILAISFESAKPKSKQQQKYISQSKGEEDYEITEEQKKEQDKQIYKNFIESVINLFDELEFKNHELKMREQRDKNWNDGNQQKGKQTTKVFLDKKGRNKNSLSNGTITVRIFATRFYRLLEDKEEHIRDVRNPARALKGKRKKRPKIFQNFIQEQSKDVQVDLMKCYFFKKYDYRAKEIFERAYFVDFSSIEKAIHKFRQKSAILKQGQNLKKINKQTADVKDMLDQFNNYCNIGIVSDQLISLAYMKLQSVISSSRLSDTNSMMGDELSLSQYPSEKKIENTTKTLNYQANHTKEEEEEEEDNVKKAIKTHESDDDVHNINDSVNSNSFTTEVNDDPAEQNKENDKLMNQENSNDDKKQDTQNILLIQDKQE